MGLADEVAVGILPNPVVDTVKAGNVIGVTTGIDPYGAAAGLLATHVAAADPHTVYQKESEKDVANGYVGLNASSRITCTSIVVGGGANTVTLASTGATLAGTARVNKIVNLGIDGLAQGSSAPVVRRLGNYYGYEFSINDDGYVRAFEVPYDADLSSPLMFHIHWYINEAYALGSGEVRWNFNYTACAENAETVEVSTTTLDFGDVNIPATAKILTETTSAIAAGIVEFDDVIGIQVKRVVLAGGSDPTADPVIVGLELEYVANVLGEAV